MQKTMRAALLARAGAADELRMGEIATPDRVNAEFLVKVVAASVNPIDAKTRAGRGTFGAIRNLPAVLGHDFSGVVVESPYRAHPIKPGDEVFGMVMVPRFSGTYAEYVSVPSLSVVRKPSTLSHIEAAGAPLAALTAWGMVVEVAKAHEGQRMLIHAGSGGVGHFAVQFASYFGAQVTATASGANASWLRSLGASTVIDHTTTRFEEVANDMDVVIDLIGNVHDDTGTRSLSVLRPGGLIVNAPTAAGRPSPRRPPPPGCAAPTSRSPRTATPSPSSPACWSRATCVCTSTRSSRSNRQRRRTEPSSQATPAARSC